MGATEELKDAPQPGKHEARELKDGKTRSSPSPRASYEQNAHARGLLRVREPTVKSKLGEGCERSDRVAKSSVTLQSAIPLERASVA